MEMSSSKNATPSSNWFANGEEDPHKGKYDCERHDLTLGDLTDDQLANEVFMWGDHRPSPEEIIGGNAKMPVVYLTAGKERIRWLSRKLNSHSLESDKLRKELEQAQSDIELLLKLRVSTMINPSQEKRLLELINSQKDKLIEQ